MKFIERWKEEWWLKHAGELLQKYAQKRIALVERCETEIKQTTEVWEQQKLSLEQKIRLEEEEIKYRLESMESRKQELLKVDNDLKTQIKILEAKAHPSEVWGQAFTAGATKAWDLLQPFMMENIEKIKKQLYDDAYTKALGTLNGNSKKTH